MAAELAFLFIIIFRRRLRRGLCRFLRKWWRLISWCVILGIGFSRIGVMFILKTRIQIQYRRWVVSLNDRRKFKSGCR